MVPEYPIFKFPVSSIPTFDGDEDDGDTKKETKEEDGPKPTPGRGGTIPNPADQDHERKIHAFNE